jgi:hypothetical protein
MLLKGPGSFKKILKIGGNDDKLKAYCLIPLTPPLYSHFTIPLNRRCQELLVQKYRLAFFLNFCLPLFLYLTDFKTTCRELKEQYHEIFDFWFFS